jgi:uncharacterized protein YciW
VEFLRAASGDAAAPLAVLRRDDGSLPPRARALARLAATLTAQPWALTPEAVEDARRQGLDEEQVEAAVGVISMFNYFTRVADATGIEFDYVTPLPVFEPDRCQVTAPRPSRSDSSSPDAGCRPRPRHQQLRVAWESWRAYVLEADEPLGRRERQLLARVAAEEAADWDGSEALSGLTGDESAEHGDDLLAGFARKLSREPWQMEAPDLERMRASGYSDEAVLHAISVVAHQNADSRLAAGLRAAGR